MFTNVGMAPRSHSSIAYRAAWREGTIAARLDTFSEKKSRSAKKLEVSDGEELLLSSPTWLVFQCFMLRSPAGLASG